jgi:hypothetical protein
VSETALFDRLFIGDGEYVRADTAIKTVGALNAEIASLRAQLDEARILRPTSEAAWREQSGPWAHLTKKQTDELIEACEKQARRKAIEDAAQKVERFYIAPKPTSRAAQFHERNVRAILAAEIRAILSESKT